MCSPYSPIQAAWGTPQRVNVVTLQGTNMPVIPSWASVKDTDALSRSLSPYKVTRDESCEWVDSLESLASTWVIGEAEHCQNF